MQPNVEPVSSSATAVSSSAFTRRRRNPAVLIQWIEEHSHNPYPTKSEKQYLAVYAGMSLRQLNDWFANARRNIKKIGYDLWKKKHTGFSAILSGMPQQTLPFPERSNYENSPLSITPSAETSVPPNCLSLSPPQCNAVTASDSPVGVGVMHPPCAEGASYQPNVRPFQAGPFALWGIPSAPNQFRGHVPPSPPCRYYRYPQLPGAQPIGLYEATSTWNGDTTHHPQLWNMSVAMAPEVNGYYSRIVPEVP